MDFYETVRRRRSIREFKDTPVPREAVERILQAGRLAPSWRNRQCWRYILISDPSVRRMLGEILHNPSMACYENAPYALALCADPTDSGSMGGKDYYLVDCGISMEHVMLAAAAEGLGTCWIGYFPENPVRALLGVPSDVKVVAITPLGVPAEAPEPRPRKELAEIAYENRFGSSCSFEG